MLKNKSLVSIILFCFISFITKISQAEEHDYEYLNAGDCLTESGFFFNEKGMIKLTLNIEDKLKTLNIENNKKLELLNIELQKTQFLRKNEIQIQKDMYEEKLNIKQQTIEAQQQEAFWKNIQSGFSGIVIGAIVGISTYYFISSK